MKKEQLFLSVLARYGAKHRACHGPASTTIYAAAAPRAAKKKHQGAHCNPCNDTNR